MGQPGMRERGAASWAGHDGTDRASSCLSAGSGKRGGRRQGAGWLSGTLQQELPSQQSWAVRSQAAFRPGPTGMLGSLLADTAPLL